MIDLRERQWENALGPILRTEFGIVIDFKEEHQWNARKPILVTESGITTDSSDSQWKNAESPMLVIDDGITRSFMSLYSVNGLLLIVQSLRETSIPSKM